MTSDPLAPLIEALHASRLRIWSIVVTIFGDCIEPRGGRAAMTELQAITDRLGIEGGALRTAMSRLAQDDWVERDREGRNSFYTLTPLGSSITLPASQQIYRAQFSDPDKPWVIAISQTPADPSKYGPAFIVTRQVQIIGPDRIAERRAAGDLILQGTPDEVPDWVHVDAVGPFLTLEYARLEAVLGALTPQQLAQLEPLDALALRILLIHNWRRLVLRHPAPPQGLTGPFWPGETCHAALARLYPELVKASEGWWTTPTSTSGMRTLNNRFQA